MCQLLGMNCNVPTDVMFSFAGFAERGGGTDHHATAGASPSSRTRACAILSTTSRRPSRRWPS